MKKGLLGIIVLLVVTLPLSSRLLQKHYTLSRFILSRLHNSKEQADMARERLINAAVIESITLNNKTRSLSFAITNRGAGHSIPTGVANIRQVWVTITIHNIQGKVLYTKGRAAVDGSLPRGTISYGVTFGDGKGNVVKNINKAREIVRDYRLNPLEKRVEVTLPSWIKGKVIVTVRLNYRSIDPTLLKLSKKELPPVPVIIMAAAKKKLIL